MRLAELEDIVMRCTRRLASLVRPNGRFIYRYDGATRLATPGYNVLRHSGCAWALNMAQQVTDGDGRDAAAAADRAMAWLAEHRIQEGQAGQQCVVERSGHVKLGGNALAVLALTTAGTWTPTLERTVRGLCDYIEAQERPGQTGEYVHKRVFETGQALPFRSDYYTGEALLALLSASLRLADRRMCDDAIARILALADRGYGIAQQSHWMMYAAAVAHSLEPNRQLAGFAAAIVANILAVPVYRDRNACTPIACRSEALLSYLLIFGGQPDGFATQARETAEENLNLQLKDFRPDGSFVKGNGSQEVRIDYLQHNLTSLLLYRRLLQANPASGGADRAGFLCAVRMAHAAS